MPAKRMRLCLRQKGSIQGAKVIIARGRSRVALELLAEFFLRLGKRSVIHFREILLFKKSRDARFYFSNCCDDCPNVRRAGCIYFCARNLFRVGGEYVEVNAADALGFLKK